MTDQSANVSHEKAKQDLEDILDLKKYAPFQRYFVRRLSQKRGESDDKSKRGKTPEEREQHRQNWLLLDELLSMMIQDEAACRSTLEATSTGLASVPRN